MNAFTSGDHTTYPFATTNKVDYNNLMDVYVDATLKPLLKESDFKQEGWRLGPEDPADAESPLLFKGVVYNEMKGQMSDSSYLYYIRFQDHMFPAIHNSGGDPAKIPDLTVEQLRKFHRDHYNASNAKLFTYGDIPLEEHAKRLNEKFSGLGRSNVDTDLRVPPTLRKDESVTMNGPIDPMTDKDAQHKTSISWVMNDTSDVIETFALRILSTYMLDGYGSPLYRGLIDEKLGSDFSPNTGYDTSSPKGIWSVGLQNIRAENVEVVHRQIKKVMQEVHDKGFEQQKIDGILHQLELQLKHKTAKFGMNVMNSLMPAWFNGVDPFDQLAWESTVNAFKERLAEGGYLEGLMEKYILDKPTFAFTMYPDANYGKSLETEEAARLAEELEKVGGAAAARDGLVKQEKELLELQEAARNEDLNCLPKVHVSDIPREMEKKPVHFTEIGGNKVQWRVAPTNGLTYFRAIKPLNDLPDEYRMYLPLFTESIFRLGAGGKPMEYIEDQIKLKTGGISASTRSGTNHSSLEITEEGLVFSGYCLDSNVPEMLELLRLVLQETNFKAVSKLRTLIHGISSNFVDSIASSGHSFAQMFAASSLTPASRTSEVLGGLTQVRLMTKLAADELYNDALEKLSTISTFASSRTNLRLAITCSSSAESSNASALSTFLSNLPTTPHPSVSELYPTPPPKSFFPMPYQVSYAATCLKTVPYTHPDGAPLQILSQLLTHKHLHHEIREKGGAYGGGAFHRALAGIFGFYSYRDPNIPNTLKIMTESGRWAAERAWTEGELEEAKLSVFQSVDAPQSVAEEGMTLFSEGITDDMRQVQRERLLDVDAQAVKRVAEMYLVEALEKEMTAVSAVVGARGEWVGKEEWAELPMSVEEGELTQIGGGSERRNYNGEGEGGQGQGEGGKKKEVEWVTL